MPFLKVVNMLAMHFTRLLSEQYGTENRKYELSCCVMSIVRQASLDFTQIGEVRRFKI